LEKLAAISRNDWVDGLITITNFGMISPDSLWFRQHEILSKQRNIKTVNRLLDVA